MRLQVICFAEALIFMGLLKEEARGFCQWHDFADLHVCRNSLLHWVTHPVAFTEMVFAPEVGRM